MADGERFRSKIVPTLAAELGISEEEAADHHAGEYALRRITREEDVANACLFLASAVSRQITGVDLPVDGGWAML
jgi:3-oxoacyl-[acyl-carrier protein] reductase